MWVKLLLLFFAASFLYRTDLSFDQDLGRHIKLGEVIINTLNVPKVNLFSYTNPDFPFINTHWLFGVIAHIFNQTIGLQFFLIFKFGIFIFSVWVILKIIPKESDVLLLPIGFIFLHVLRERLELRPEIFSFLFTAVTYYILEKSSQSRSYKLLFLLPLIQLIWVNTHIYFFVGLLLQAIFIIHLTHQKLRFNLKGGKLKFLSIIFILSVFLSLINPNGLTGLLYPLNVNQNYGYSIVENQTMFLLESINFKNPNFFWVKISAFLLVLSLLIGLIRRRFNLKNYLLAVFALTLAMLNVRSFPYLVFLSLPAVLNNFGLTQKNAFTFILLLVTSAFLLSESFFYLNGAYYKYKDDQHQVGFKLVESVKGGMDYVLANNLEGPVYNNFDIGSYIIFRGYPKYQVFVDGRPEAYPKDFFQQIYIPSQADYTKFKELEEKYGFKTIIFSHTDQTPWGRNFLQNVIKDQTWKLVYTDDFMLVLVKDSVAKQKNLKAVDLTNLSPSIYKFNNHLSYLRTGIFLLSMEEAESAKQFIGRTLQIFPQSPTANSIIGNPINNKFFW